MSLYSLLETEGATWTTSGQRESGRYGSYDGRINMEMSVRGNGSWRCVVEQRSCDMCEWFKSICNNTVEHEIVDNV